MWMSGEKPSKLRVTKPIGLALTGVLVVGCIPSFQDGSPGSDAEATSSFSTPLEARDELLSLKVFGYCSPVESLDSGLSRLNCFIEDEEKVRGLGVRVTRGVLVLVSRDETETSVMIREVCQTENLPEDVPLVTDNDVFVALGVRGSVLGEDLYDLNKWPPELWPEDVQRALGGAVTSKRELCRAL